MHKWAKKPALIAAWFGFAALAGCSAPGNDQVFLPIGDVRPPVLVAVNQVDSGLLELDFNEDVAMVADSFVFQPKGVQMNPAVEGNRIQVAFSPRLDPGTACTLSGEAEDRAGNRLKFLISFAGYNEHPAKLRLNEVQPGKNSSVSNPHRDYIEFFVLENGNLGGVTVEWASSVKSYRYQFPAADVRAGECVVLHCAPEGIPAERDETGPDCGLSGGIDASLSGRDFWTSAGGLPDSTGVIAVRTREKDPVCDGLFYADTDKAGALESKAFGGLPRLLADANIWPSSGAEPAWEDAFIWKSSTSRPLQRIEGAESGKSAWCVGEAGSQSPGEKAPREVPSKSAARKAGKKKTSP